MFGKSFISVKINPIDLIFLIINSLFTFFGYILEYWYNEIITGSLLFLCSKKKKKIIKRPTLTVSIYGYTIQTIDVVELYYTLFLYPFNYWYNEVITICHSKKEKKTIIKRPTIILASVFGYPIYTIDIL